MGHRSWLVEVATINELKKAVSFLEKADELCGYSTFALPECFCKVDKTIYFGFSSDGSGCGAVFQKTTLHKKRFLGLLGEDIQSESLTYLGVEEALASLSTKATKGELKKITKEIVKRFQRIEKETGA